MFNLAGAPNVTYHGVGATTRLALIKKGRVVNTVKGNLKETAQNCPDFIVKDITDKDYVSIGYLYKDEKFIKLGLVKLEKKLNK